MTVRGFTVLELMVVVTILAILASVAVPTYTGLIDDSRKRSVVSSLSDAIKLARLEAITRGQSVVVCPSDDGFDCLTGASANWSEGVLLQTAVAGDVLSYWQGFPEHVTVSSAGLGDSLQLDPAGMASVSGSFAVCDRRGPSDASAVILLGSGLARLGVDGDGDGLVEVHTGADITC